MTVLKIRIFSRQHCSTVQQGEIFVFFQEGNQQRQENVGNHINFFLLLPLVINVC